MSVQLYSYGACVRLVTDNSVLMLAKSQVKRIEVVRQDTVKISLGDGTLNEILIKVADVTQPAGLVDVADLRDAITHLLDKANLYEEEALINQQALLTQLSEIKQLFNLWYGAQQLELNFEQLQVNALVAIANRLLESKENDERLISHIQDQTTELKGQSLQLQGMDLLLAAIKSTADNSLNKQEILTGTAADIKVTTGLIQTGITTGLNEQKAQSDLLTAGNALLTTIKSVMDSVLTKQDAQTVALTDIKTTVGLVQGILGDTLRELKTQTGKITSTDQTLCDIKAQNTVYQRKQDAIIQLMNDIKVLLKK